MRTLSRNKRAITPVLSSLLLTIVAVAGMSLAATAAYLISDNLHQNMGERFIVEDVWFKAGEIGVYLHNIGEVDITVSNVYMNSTSQSIIPLSLQMGKSGWLNFTYIWASGRAYHIHIVTTRGTKVADYYVAP